jgi:rfaE bifunctional protein nucleotidyltransferase chain/domain
MTEKIVSAGGAGAIARELSAGRRKLVFTNGCFDLLHVGHVRYLAAARALGDALLVAINGDESVRALKGDGRPINPAADRAEVVAALECVDYVVIFNEVRATALLKQVSPAIYVKGGDYSAETLDSEERQALEEMGAEIRIVPFEAGYSTSSLLKKFRGTRPA